MKTQNGSARVKLAGDTDLYGTFDATLLGTAGGEPLLVRLDDGRTVMLPRDAFVPVGDGSYELRLGADTLSKIARAGEVSLSERTVIPLVAETLTVGKREVETGRVRVTKFVNEREELIEQLLRKDEVTVERVPVGRVVEEPVAVREEGDVLIIPLVEEVLVVEKRLMLREELRVTRRAAEVPASQRVTLRSEDVRVERISAAGEAEHGTDVA